MTRLHDIVIIVDQQEEYTALQECVTLEILTIYLTDTNSDPNLVEGNMNGISNTLNGLYDISGVKVGQHFYWQIAGSAVIVVRNPQTIPIAGQNFFEYVLEFIRDVLCYLRKSYNYLMES
ncbi:hypothetical protein J1N35_046151 [Gossypium stocksii]|uniref:Uncharacterized protein n=1 Tax=Gossypium stocksii TaxID=47602 RepID=A0A9D3ZDZ9_9ROSI|nr:hypothetical protein J1N35_046151 [Gossypium stocksii]